MQLQNTFLKADIPPTGCNLPCKVWYHHDWVRKLGYRLMRCSWRHKHLLWSKKNAISWRESGTERQQQNTLCFCSSNLSPTASLAAVARVLSFASLSLATSRAHRSVTDSMARVRLRTYSCCPLSRRWIRHLGRSQRAGWRRSCAK